MSEKWKILHDGETSYGTACTGEEVVVDPQSTETVKSLLRKAGGTWGHGESHHLLEEKEPARKRKLLEKMKIEPSIGEQKSGKFSFRLRFLCAGGCESGDIVLTSSLQAQGESGDGELETSSFRCEKGWFWQMLLLVRPTRK